jgi:hypothetical protein
MAGRNRLQEQSLGLLGSMIGRIVGMEIARLQRELEELNPDRLLPWNYRAVRVRGWIRRGVRQVSGELYPGWHRIFS